MSTIQVDCDIAGYYTRELARIAVDDTSSHAMRVQAAIEFAADVLAAIARGEPVEPIAQAFARRVIVM